MNKRICFCCILIVFLAFLGGCTPPIVEVPFDFRKTVEQIEYVEILEKAEGFVGNVPCRVVAILDPEYHGLLIETAENTQCYENYGGGCRYQLRIHYTDGETEIWGYWMTAILHTDGEVEYLNRALAAEDLEAMVETFLVMGKEAAP